MLGFLLGLVLWVLPSMVSFAVTTASTNPDLSTFGGILWIALMVGVVVLAAWLVARPSTRRTGAGIFIALGAIPIIAAGVCVALLAGLASLG
ncbi:MAG: hypothetical protein L0G22_00730 [Propionibacteriaceae bacterium]|nr:hypothetical protein [Propionibacteriaceae bacterium]